MVEYVKKCENDIKDALSREKEYLNKELLDQFKTRIEFIQHERLIHLIVTLFFALFFLITTLYILLSSTLELALLDILFLGMLVAYIIHYYRLENGVQRLYELYDSLDKNY